MKIIFVIILEIIATLLIIIVFILRFIWNPIYICNRIKESWNESLITTGSGKIQILSTLINWNFIDDVVFYKNEE